MTTNQKGIKVNNNTQGLLSRSKILGSRIKVNPMTNKVLFNNSPLSIFAMVISS